MRKLLKKKKLLSAASLLTSPFDSYSSKSHHKKRRKSKTVTFDPVNHYQHRREYERNRNSSNNSDKHSTKPYLSRSQLNQPNGVVTPNAPEKADNLKPHLSRSKPNQPNEEATSNAQERAGKSKCYFSRVQLNQSKGEVTPNTTERINNSKPERITWRDIKQNAIQLKELSKSVTTPARTINKTSQKQRRPSSDVDKSDKSMTPVEDLNCTTLPDRTTSSNRTTHSNRTTPSNQIETDKQLTLSLSDNLRSRESSDQLTPLPTPNNMNKHQLTRLDRLDSVESGRRVRLSESQDRTFSLSSHASSDYYFTPYDPGQPTILNVNNSTEVNSDSEDEILQVIIQQQPPRPSLRRRRISGHYRRISDVRLDKSKRVRFAPLLKGMSGRRRHGYARRAQHHRSKHGRQSSHRKGVGNKPSTRGAGGQRHRRMDHYHMRRRFHSGVMGAGGAGAMMYGPDDDLLDEDPFAENDALLEMDMMEMLGEPSALAELMPGIYDDEENGSDSDGNEGEDSDAEGEGRLADGPPALESEDHYHVFIYHTHNQEDNELVEQFVTHIENSPHDLKVLTSERDFKSELTLTQNLLLAVGFSQRILLICSQEFVELELKNFEQIAANMTEDERKNKVSLLVLEDVELPTTVEKYPKQFHIVDPDWHETLIHFLSQGPMTKDSPPPNHLALPAVVPSAPPDSGGNSKCATPQKEKQNNSAANNINEPPLTQKELPNYANGTVVKKITAGKYSSYTNRDEEKTLCTAICPSIRTFCPYSEPKYQLPASLNRRGLQITQEEFIDIVRSLTEASHVTFFQKSVDCTIPCLFISTISVVCTLAIITWFLVTGVLMNNGDLDEVYRNSSIFWAFMALIIAVPCLAAIVTMLITMYLANYKYLKYRIKVEELNKRFRETNMVLHCRPAKWSCSSKIRLYLIHYNFEQCQQNLYCHVHDELTTTGFHGSNELNNFSVTAESATHKLDRIMKRVNTLTRKFEWTYFEELTGETLPKVDKNEHRQKGMCFCQYVIYKEQQRPPQNWLDNAKGTMSSLRRNAFKKSHQRRSNIPTRMYTGYQAPLVNHYKAEFV